MLDPIAFVSEQQFDLACACVIGGAGYGCSCTGTMGIGQAPFCTYPNPR